MNNKVNNVSRISPWDDENGLENNIFTKKRKVPEYFPNFTFNFQKKTFLLAVAGVCIFWLASGIYEIREGEQAAVIRFGKFERIGIRGLNYHLPAPIESIIQEKVNQSRRIEIGYRSTGQSKVGGELTGRDVSIENIILTGDENIIELNVDVMWHISDISQFIFNVADPQDTLRAASESAIREIIGNMPIASVLSNQKQEITKKIEELIQQILNQYKVGIIVEQVQLLKAEPPREVIQSYRDVQTARADKENEINQAKAYANDLLPKARGEAAKVTQGAEGYLAEVIARAEGDISRYNAIYSHYSESKDATKTRLYLEAMEKILSNSAKIISGSEGVLPHMAINPKIFDKSETSEFMVDKD